MKNIVSLVLALMIAVFYGIINAVISNRTNRAERRAKHAAGRVGKFAETIAKIFTIILIVLIAANMKTPVPIGIGLLDQKVIDRVRERNYLTTKEEKMVNNIQTILDNPESSEEELIKAEARLYRIVEVQLSGKHEKFNTWEKVGRFVHYRVDKGWRIHLTTEGCNAISELKNVTPSDVHVVAWKDIGFSFAPSILILHGKKSVLYCSTNGGLKDGTAIYVSEEALAHNKVLTEEEFQIHSNPKAFKDAMRLRNQASLMYQKSFERKYSKEVKYKFRLKAEKLISKAEKLENQDKITLINPKRPVAKFNQGRALRFSPSTKIGKMLMLNDVNVVKDVEVEVKVNLEVIDPVTYKHHPIDKWTFKVTDGLGIISVSKAIKLGISNRCKAFQMRDSDGSIKGLLIIVPDNYFDGIKRFATKTTWNDCHKEFNDQVILFESVVKDFAKFASLKDYMTNGRQLRRCDTHENVKGHIHVSRQLIQMLALGATNEEDLKNIVSDTVAELKELSTEEGYYELVKGIMPSIKDPRFEELKNSPAVVNSACKQVWNKIHHACAARVKVQGAELFCTPSIKDVINKIGGINAELDLKRGECRVDRRCGVAIGEKVVVCRYPYINPEPTILTVVGYTDVPGIIEVSIDDIVMIKLDCDFDGDHLIVIWDKRIVKMAEKTAKLVEDCEARTFVFDDVPASDEAKAAPLWKYITMCAKMGNVGKATVPIFTLCSMVPLGAKPDTEVSFGTMALTVKQIREDEDYQCYIDDIPDGAQDDDIVEEPEFITTVDEIIFMMQMVKVAVTIEADAGKRMAAGKFGETDVAKWIKEIRKEYAPKSEFFAHPNSVKPVFVELGKDEYEVVYATEKRSNNDETRTKKLIPVYSAMNAITEIILREVTGSDDIWFIDSENGRNYRTVIKSKENPDGFLFVPEAANPNEDTPEDKLYKGIHSDNWFVETGLDWYDEDRETPMCIDLDEIKENTVFEMDDTKIIGKKPFKEYILHDFEEKLDKLEKDDDDRIKVSLKENKWAGLSVGIIHHRLLKAMLSYSRKLSDPRTKIEILLGNENEEDSKFCKNGLDKHVCNIIRLYCNACGLECSAEQAEIILYDELAKWLFSKHANESSAADMQDFFAKYKDSFLKVAGVKTDEAEELDPAQIDAAELDIDGEME